MAAITNGKIINFMLNTAIVRLITKVSMTKTIAAKSRKTTAILYKYFFIINLRNIIVIIFYEVYLILGKPVFKKVMAAPAITK